MPKGKKIVLTGGVFDILHYGHARYLNHAKKAGDFVVVAIESDETVQRKKNKPPIFSQKERAELISHLRSVDEVILLPPKTDYMRLVQEVHPDYILVPEDDPLLAAKQEQAKAVGAQIISYPHIPEVSSTAIKERIKQN